MHRIRPLRAGAFICVLAAAAIGCQPMRGAEPGMSPAAGADPSLARADADMRAVLEQHMALGPRPIETLTPAEARQQPTIADAVKALLQRQGRSTAPEPVGSVVNRTIPGPDGPIPVRIYTPVGTGPFPVVVYSHGGGWVIATIDTYDSSARALTNAAQAIVISIEYRKGPENRFPAAHDDAFAAYQWALANAASIGGDPNRVATAGESAGGGLAVAAALMARERGVKLPVHVLSVYPIADGDTISPSYQEWANAKPLDRPTMAWFFRHYLRGPQDAADPRISLVDTNLRGMPPHTIINAQIDPLRSDGEELAARLRAAGVQVQQRTWEGTTHEFFGTGAVVSDAREAVAFGGGALRAAFGGR
ncbi:MAG: Esterase/lipase [uncultured Gemmatimonadetes bacterium]|uniref:Esterase/lipase n=1 Tax=uncultured Gemmatimonadota bacterium TaxID=203437 RepID=A0A6J4MQA8_9BACT|nr:MAG: Esterase/lipase [uncultured Gemmatimonadota bacterium]